MQAVEKAGMIPSGEFLQLNSYENRVFDITLEEEDNHPIRKHVVAKFYRPGRWDKETLLEEHEFIRDLKSEGIAVAEPLVLSNKSTLAEIENIWVAFFKKGQGRLVQEFLPQDLTGLGKILAQVHNVGAQKKFKHRPIMDGDFLNAWPSLDILDRADVSPEVSQRYFEAASQILNFYEEKINQYKKIRIHGDCHRGNWLHNGEEYVLVDFDDCVMGPAVQDFWMLLSGDADLQNQEIDSILKGYEDFRHFDESEIEVIPCLKGLRIISYAAWIAKRWDDPFFKKTFTEFGTYSYWVEETESLEKIAWSL